MKKRRKPNRNTIFVDLPVTKVGRERAKLLKKKTGARTYDEMIDKVFKEMMDQELI